MLPMCRGCPANFQQGADSWSEALCPNHRSQLEKNPSRIHSDLIPQNVIKLHVPLRQGTFAVPTLRLAGRCSWQIYHLCPVKNSHLPDSPAGLRNGTACGEQALLVHTATLRIGEITSPAPGFLKGGSTALFRAMGCSAGFAVHCGLCCPSMWLTDSTPCCSC